MEIVSILENYDFNSHAHVERDLQGYEMIITGERNFNSHAHVERDSERLLWHNQTAISTHTLTWSVTFTIPKREELKNISTHTLTWSVTPFSMFLHLLVLFQLTRSRGA